MKALRITLSFLVIGLLATQGALADSKPKTRVKCDASLLGVDTVASMKRRLDHKSEKLSDLRVDRKNLQGDIARVENELAYLENRVYVEWDLERILEEELEDLSFQLEELDEAIANLKFEIAELLAEIASRKQVRQRR